MKNEKVKQLVVMAMLAALAYVLMVLIRIPVVSFLKYEPKDVIITIGGFIYGPLTAFLISFVVSLIEMITVSETGPIGAVMNLISTCAFACTAALAYWIIPRLKHKLKGAIIGLILGVIVMIGVMMLWNYFLTPIYMGYPREAVAAMLPTVFLPFNALKGALNAAITMLLYKPVVLTLRKAHLVPDSFGAPRSAGKKVGTTIGVAVSASAVLITCIVLILVLRGII